MLEKRFLSAAAVLRAEVRARAKRIDDMRNYSGSVRVIFGQDDQTLNVGVAQEFHDLFANSTLHIIKNANHFVHLEQADLVAMIILAEGP